MNMAQYQISAKETAIYPQAHAVTYPILGLAGEIGDFANKWKKTIRDGATLDPEWAMHELGDMLWYLSAICTDLHFDLSDVAQMNVDKLRSRAERGVLGGNGDER